MFIQIQIQMQKTFTLQNMETYFSNYISCNEHKKQPITNFCTENPCLKFLCPECIETHSLTHSNHSIESIKTCIKKTSQRLKQTIFTLESESNRNSFLKSENTDEYTKKLIRELEQVKQGLIQEIKAYFREKQYDIRKQTSKYVQIQRKLEYLKRDLSKATSQLKLLQRNLLIPQQTVNAIMKANKLSFNGMVKHFHNRINQIQLQISLTIKLQMNSEKREILRKSLNQLVGIRSQKDQILKKQSNYMHKDEKFIKQSRKKQKKINKVYQVSTAPLSADRILQQGSFLIDTSNYFIRNPFLHFFSVANSTLHIINIEKIKQSISPKWQAIHLNIDFKLPAFHRTVATQDGNILVIGGTCEFQPNLKRSKAIYQFNPINSTLKLICEMKIPRSSHSVLCHRGLIYISGGMTDNQQVLKKCQMLNTKTRQIQLIASCRNATTNSCLCLMGGDQVIKLGGVFPNGQNNDTIEVYSIRNDVWQGVDPTIQHLNGQFGLLSCSGWARLNQNQTFIFGGYDQQSDNSNSKMSFVLQQNRQTNEFQIKYINQKNPPFAQGFWNQQGVAYNGEIYCLQNMDGLVEEQCLEDRKHLLIFNGKTWTSFLDGQ